MARHGRWHRWRMGHPRAEKGSPWQGEGAVLRVRSCWQGWGAPGAGGGGGLGSPPPRLTALDGRQAEEIRSQFQAVPTERCYQDETCRTEYFKTLSGPPSGAGTGATALAGGGEAAGTETKAGGR